jgi:hypothetical protein
MNLWGRDNLDKQSDYNFSKCLFHGANHVTTIKTATIMIKGNAVVWNIIYTINASKKVTSQGSVYM